MKFERWINVSIWILLTVISVGIRLVAARDAYPSCGDSSHFVQHGVALANGVPGAMSTYWSQGMILIAAGAEKMGLDPRYAMQTTTLVSGVGVVLLFSGIIWMMTNSRNLALVGGLILAANVSMVHYSITGYSEMPFMLFLMGGVCVGVTKRLNSSLRYGLAGMLIGVGGYFKGLDASVAACGFGLYVILSDTEDWIYRCRSAVMVVAIALVVLLPLCIFTYMETGQFSPGSKGSGNFVAGADWADSKKIYAVEGMTFLQKTSADIVREIPSRIVHNFADFFRVINMQFFVRGFRMGTIWFFGLSIVGAILYFRYFDKTFYLPICMVGIQLGLLLIVFVHDRLLIPSLPWIFLALILTCSSMLRNANMNRRVVFLAGLVVMIFIGINACYALESFRTEWFWWRYSNMVECAYQLKVHGGTDQDVVMTYGPTLAVEFNKTNPLKTVEVPFGSIEKVEKLADQQDVRFIVISDVFRSHWPIADLFDDRSMAPANWKLLQEITFPEEELSGHPRERCRIYERVVG